MKQKNLSVLFRAITSKHDGDFHYLNCLYSFGTKSKHESNKKVCENMLEFNQCYKCDKTQSIIYDDLESLIKKVDGCKKNHENSSTTKVGEHIPSGFQCLWWE